jgi:hypothetical protein
MKFKRTDEQCCSGAFRFRFEDLLALQHVSVSMPPSHWSKSESNVQNQGAAVGGERSGRAPHRRAIHAGETKLISARAAGNDRMIVKPHDD